MKGKKQLSEGDDVTEINISPLIDMVFILLIFFIVTTVFVEEEGMAANTPDPTPPLDQPEQEDKPVSFTIRYNGQVVFDKTEQDVGVGGIRGIVRPAVQNKQENFTLNVETRAIMDLVVDVMDECYLAGAKQVVMKSIDEE